MDTRIQILEFFNGINEYDMRHYLRICIDIYYNCREEEEKNYPNEVFSFIYLIRGAFTEMDDGEFMDYVNEKTCQDEDDLYNWIVETLDEGLKSFDEFAKSLQSKKPIIEYDNEEVTA